MSKLLDWFKNNLLAIATGFLLIFIPLWPKIPVMDIMHTWVYIRLEDFVILAVLFIWIILLLRGKVNLKTPLTMPILIFWTVGAISTIHSLLLIIPKLSDIYPNLALLNYLRRIEYLSLFFVAYSATKEKKIVSYMIVVLMLTLFMVFGYGLGQKLFGFPAFLTMNEEFAKGVGVRLSSMSRISSTFGGHYDLAAYLVLILPLLASLVFGFKNWLMKILLLLAVFCGLILLFMTVSRISFFVLLLSFLLVLFFQKKKIIIFLSLGVVSLMTIFLLIFSPSLLQRFGNTVKEVNVLIDTQTGNELGHVKEIQTRDLGEKVIKILPFRNKESFFAAIQEEMSRVKPATTAGIISSSLLPATIPLLLEPNTPTGENLPQGTGYINLSLSPIVAKPTDFLLKNPKISPVDFFNFQGDFLIKKALAYDLSFTTRFQGEWPKTIDAFKRNIFFGSGYSSVGLAVDNNYLRILGETGLLGFLSFFSILFTIAIYIKKTLPKIIDPLEKSFVIGFSAGLLGLVLNAIFIDVFEASKVAFLLWLLTGITLGILSFYEKKDLFPAEIIKKALSSKYAIIFYLFVLLLILFSPILNNYFIADDFTWLRWQAEQKSSSLVSVILNYFTNSDGFFYRPGTKLYFFLMYQWFWLNQTAYYSVSVLLHFLAVITFFFISQKILKNLLMAALAVFLFMILSGYLEAVFWISSTGHLFNAVLILLSLFFFMHRYFYLSVLAMILSLFFHELGIVAPLLIILYRSCFQEKFDYKNLLRNRINQLLLLPIIPYLGLRLLARSHWFNGDYSYNLLKLPFNLAGNTIGYLTLDLFGPFSLPFYQKLRDLAKGHLLMSILFFVAVIYLLVWGYRKFMKKLTSDESKIVIFGFGYFFIALLPFIGLGNIASRYSYLSGMGFILVLVILIKKLYEYLLIVNGKRSARAMMILAVCLFFLIHLIQLQKVQGDWSAASDRVKRFLISADSLYSDSRTKEKVKFYFVNVPIRYGDAWIFPTGLNDVLWFVFHNQNLSSFQFSSLDEALKTAGDFTNEQIFEFDPSGKLIERKKILQ